MKDHSSDTLSWEGTFLSNFDPMKPHWIDDREGIDAMVGEKRDEMREIFKEVDFNDSKRDLSLGGLTEDE